MKTALCIGHNSNNQGAYSLYLQESEWMYNSSIAIRMKDVADIYYREDAGGYTNEIIRLAKQVNKQPYDLAIEMHFNAAIPSAHGCEALYYSGSKKGEEYAQLFCEIITRNYGTRNRGAKQISTPQERGYGFLHNIDAPAIILEPFFGSNIEAVQYTDKKMYECVLREFLTECGKLF